MKLDEKIFHLINGQAKQRRWLDALGYFCAEKLPFFYIIPVLIFPQSSSILRVFITVIVARLMIELFRKVAPRKRPRSIRLVMSQPNPFSFPSSHATIFFSLGAVFLTQDYLIGAVFLSLAFVISLARVFVGIHWPSDVTAGAIIGSLIGFTVGYW